MALIFTEVLQTFGLVTDDASKFDRLAADTVTALRVSRTIQALGAVEHRIAEFLQLSLRESILHTDFLARLAFYSESG